MRMNISPGEPGRVAVITGGAGAIGSAITSALQRSGHKTVVIDRSGDVICDLASEDSTRQAAAEVLARHGRCDVFVHCAAAFNHAALADIDLSTWRQVQAVNVESAVWLAQAFTPGMVERGFGRIVFIASDTVWSPPSPQLLPYIASKGALIAVMRTLAATLGPSGIAVSAVAPGLTDTPPARAANTDEIFDATVALQALKRRLTADDAAAAVAYLVSDGAAAMTGQVLCADGGLIMR
jgi:NAD(P)-dependent dehydrogenase (short-subunit alcohol dehydrogenase family)